jgi:hypothetical protein
MKILDALRNRGSGSDSQTRESGPPDSFPIDRYDRLDPSEINGKLSGLSQEQLTVVEEHERAHENREAVFGKLRYLREQEPMEGYDGLDSSAVKQALRSSDPATIRAVRDYERKFAHRPDVLAETARLLIPASKAQPS